MIRDQNLSRFWNQGSEMWVQNTDKNGISDGKMHWVNGKTNLV